MAKDEYNKTFDGAMTNAREIGTTVHGICAEKGMGGARASATNTSDVAHVHKERVASNIAEGKEEGKDK